jgi:hypothetical protein
MSFPRIACKKGLLKLHQESGFYASSCTPLTSEALDPELSVPPLIPLSKAKLKAHIALVGDAQITPQDAEG